jgi:hypothetical protein
LAVEQKHASTNGDPNTGMPPWLIARSIHHPNLGLRQKRGTVATQDSTRTTLAKRSVHRLRPIDRHSRPSFGRYIPASTERLKTRWTEVENTHRRWRR